jgi:hypothetical protein
MKPTRSAASTPDAHGPLTVRVLTDLTERQRFDTLLEAEHFLGPRFPAGAPGFQTGAVAGKSMVGPGDCTGAWCRSIWRNPPDFAHPVLTIPDRILF